MQSHLPGLCWLYLLGFWDGLELGSPLAALEGAPTQDRLPVVNAGHAHSGPHLPRRRLSRPLETGGSNHKPVVTPLCSHPHVQNILGIWVCLLTSKVLKTAGDWIRPLTSYVVFIQMAGGIYQ